jgi:hypothetical protein
VADKKHSTCSASDELAAGVVDIDTEALVPYDFQTLVAVDIDRAMSSCLEELKKKVSIKLRVENECLSNTYKARAEFEFRVEGAYLSMLRVGYKILVVLELAVETRHIPQ